MARHVVDPQHFQRLAPDFRVSTDEILFRAQPGCPVELGELAIHCVHPLPQHRPKLREVVERLTAIENVDIHVGTTLVVAPSVARAARNMAMKQQAEAKKQQDKQPLYLHGNVGLYPGGMQPENGYPTTSSSIRGVAESSRMTRMTDASSNPSSRMTSSDFVGSQSTFRGRPWKQQGGSRELEFQVGSSVIPLVLGERLREREPSEMYETSTVSMRSSEGSEDEHAFRMPRWDSINSPDNLEQLRQWHQSNPAGGSVMDEEEVLRSWDQERHHQRGESRPNLSQLSSIQLELNEHDDDGEYSCSLDSDDGSSDEELDSLFDESSDYGSESRIYGQMGGTGTYQLSSDSDASLSSSSLTESVVRALDTLEIPDLQMASLPGLPRDSSAMTPDLDLEMVGIREAMDAALGSSVYPQDDDGENTKVFRKPQLISRLLPPIPLSENPWTSFQSPQANTGLATERKEDGVVVVDHHHPPQNDASGTAPVLHAINVLRTETLTIGTTAVEAKEISEAAAEASDTPPEPPSKSSLLLRSYSLKSNPSPPTTINVASPPTDKEPTPTAPEETPCTTTLTAVDSAPTSTASSETSASSVSSASSTGEPVVKTEEDGQTNAAENTTNGTTPHPPPRGPLVRGMSDSLLESTSASNTVESGYTITGNIIAAMGARTWTSGTGGFGHWISQYTQGDPAADKTGLKKHTSLKEGKQQRLLVNELSNLHGLEESEDTTADRMLVSEPLPSVKEDGPGVEPIPTVKRRAPKPLTGFPHRFSLVVFSTQLLPKCDVCLKRLGVLPGWSAKHLECDGKEILFAITLFRVDRSPPLGLAIGS